MINTNTLAYLAGVIDGEGSIGIEKTKPNLKQHQVNPRYMPNLCVVNTNKELIDWLQMKFGGSVNERKRGKYLKAHWKTCWRWRLNQGRIRELLSLCLPYMIVKKKQAEKMIEFYDKRMKRAPNERHFSGKKPFPEEEIEFRESIYREIKRLNHYDPQRLSEETPTYKTEGDAIVQLYEKS